ncbi:ABC transporter permease [Clostridium gasigenes]|uniref:ABC transporter permease n=1 Tax=Clostridium gasigenes TaxID=94869 RepID=UPI001C0D1A55|nr:ABC transporter permease subunit [Clostridium gasigenes]MBU3134817.1 ABC transporter permease [Clostridium gasigenes]
MRINPVLRNESKLAARTPKFTILLFIYIAILSAGVLVFYNLYSETFYANGLDLQSSVMLYFGMAIGQAVLLMFIVPALTSTAICSEREKQTLDMLLSSKLTPFQIIIGKLSSSSIKVIMLIICTMPIYVICGLTGGIRISNIIQLIMFFAVTTIFVGSIGVFISTYTKTSKVATALTYAIVLFIFIGTLIIAFIILRVEGMKGNGADPGIPWIVYLSPATGFMSMLSNQIGMLGQMGYMMTNMDISKYTEYISIAIQLGLSVIFIYLSVIKLNPLNTKRNLKVFKRKKS